MFLANFRKEIREDGLGIARAGSERRLRVRAAGPVGGGDSGSERKTFQEACFKWNLGRPSRATKRVLKFILLSGFSVLALGTALCIVGFVLSEANPFRIIGPVLAVYGLLILFLSFDVCMRLKAAVPSEMETTSGNTCSSTDDPITRSLLTDEMDSRETGSSPTDTLELTRNSCSSTHGRQRHVGNPTSPVTLRSWGGDRIKGLVIGRNGELVVAKPKRGSMKGDEVLPGRTTTAAVQPSPKKLREGATGVSVAFADTSIAPKASNFQVMPMAVSAATSSVHQSPLIGGKSDKHYADSAEDWQQRSNRSYASAGPLSGGPWQQQSQPQRMVPNTSRLTSAVAAGGASMVPTFPNPKAVTSKMPTQGQQQYGHQVWDDYHRRSARWEAEEVDIDEPFSQKPHTPLEMDRQGCG